MSGLAGDRFRRWLESPRFGRILACVAALLLVPSTFTGLAGDDYVHWIRAATGFPTGSRLDLFSFFGRTPDVVRIAKDMGVLPWFALDGLRLSFFRPLTSAWHFVDYNVWPHFPWLMHAENVALYVVLVLLAAALYRRLLAPPWVAALAAFFYAFDPGHGTVGWVAMRNGFLAPAFGVGALLAHDRWRRDAWRPGVVVGPSLFVAALLSGEAGLGTFAYLLAHAATLDRAPSRGGRALAVAPYVVPVVVWQAAYRALGYGAFGSSFYTDPAREPVRFLMRLPGRAAALLAGQLVLFPADASVDMSPRSIAWLALATAALVGAVGFVAWPLLRRDVTARFFTLGATLALPVVCTAFASTRVLPFIGLGVLGLLAQVVREVSDPAFAAAGRLRRTVTRAASVTIMALHAVVAPVGFLASSLLPAGIVAWTLRAAEGLPTSSELRDRTVVVLNGRMTLLAVLRFVLPLDGTIRGPRGRLLASTADEVVVSRPAEDEIELRSSDLTGDPFAAMTRDDAFPMHAGDVFSLPGMTARVESVAPSGHATKVAFLFDESLDDPRFVWITWDGERFVSTSPPRVGDERTFGGRVGVN